MSTGRVDAEVPGGYRVLTVADVVPYLQRTAGPALLAQRATADARGGGTTTSAELERMIAEVTHAEEIGDGNLNLVFRLRDAAGRSRLIVKQALPYVRCVGESWPLTVDRCRLEAQTLQRHFQFAPGCVVEVFYFDAAMSAMVLEDLTDFVIWRHELVRGRHHPHVAPQLGAYLAAVHFHTSDLGTASAAKKQDGRRCVNVAMCGITEDLFFVDPYRDHERNRFEPELLGDVVTCLRTDETLHRAVARLKRAFMTRAEALLHGDLHSGSVFVRGASAKVIDGEFGFYGPMGFDVGTLLGSLILNYVALPYLVAAGDGDAAAARARVLGDVRACWESYAATFQRLAASGTRDATFAAAGYVRELVEVETWTDAVGFGGTEMVRRTVGLAHVADLDGIATLADRVAAKTTCIRLGAHLIRHADRIRSAAALEQVIVSLGGDGPATETARAPAT